MGTPYITKVSEVDDKYMRVEFPLFIKVIWLCTNEDKLYHPAAGEYNFIRTSQQH
jgi:hypothetical protein